MASKKEETESVEAATEEKKGVSKVKRARGNKKVRLTVIGILLLLVAALFFLLPKARVALAAIFIILAAAFGLEATENDWDVGKLIETRSFEESKVGRDESGNILFDRFGEITTNVSEGKGADEYNCDDFEHQPDAQVFFERVGGTGNDVNRLDGDKDGEACESLPKGN